MHDSRLLRYLVDASLFMPASCMDVSPLLPALSFKRITSGASTDSKNLASNQLNTLQWLNNHPNHRNISFQSLQVPPQSTIFILRIPHSQKSPHQKQANTFHDTYIASIQKMPKVTTLLCCSNHVQSSIAIPTPTSPPSHSQQQKQCYKTTLDGESSTPTASFHLPAYST